MQLPDLINGGFELIGAFFTWRNAWQLRKDREIKGVYWPTTLFFAAWGLWNLVYYPTLQQWASFIGGVALVAGNLAWVVMAVRLQIQDIRNTQWRP
jgi:polyferredoxin